MPQASSVLRPLSSFPDASPGSGRRFSSDVAIRVAANMTLRRAFAVPAPLTTQSPESRRKGIANPTAVLSQRRKFRAPSDSFESGRPTPEADRRSGRTDEPVAEIVPNTQPRNYPLCFQQLAAQG